MPDDPEKPFATEPSGDPTPPGWKPIAAPAPAGRSTTKWSITYESSTDAGFLAVQTHAGDKFAEMLPLVAQTIVNSLQELRPGGKGVAAAARPGSMGWKKEEGAPDADNVVEFPGARPWFSPAFQRRLQQTEGDPAKFRAMVDEFVARFDKVFERGQNPSDLWPMISSFFLAYEGRPSDDFVAQVRAELVRLSPDALASMVRSWLLPAGASGELVTAALLAVDGLCPSPGAGHDALPPDDDDDDQEPA